MSEKKLKYVDNEGVKLHTLYHEVIRAFGWLQLTQHFFFRRGL